jgi:ABC-type dipeptide/oligopeptide/nickel transport system ATPase component/ABC-type dipeptide/oligopeptide/nickel transport system permease subunit
MTSGALSSSKVRIGAAILISFLVIAIIGPFLLDLLGLDPHAVDRQAIRQPPSARHWLGTDSSGSDLFAQWVLGARGSVFVGLTAGVLMTGIAVVVGLVAGFAGGWVDSALNSTMNLLMVIPAIPLAIIVAGYMRSVNEITIILIIGLVGWPGEARAVRSQVLSLRNRDFVTASRMVGETRTRQLFVDVLPQMSGYLFNLLLVAIVGAVFAEASLRFLGIGSPDTSSWGTMLEVSRTQGAILSGMWWWYLPPGLGIAILGAGAALLNFGFDEMVNPRLSAARPSVRRRLVRLERATASARGAGAQTVADAGDELLRVEGLEVEYLAGDITAHACKGVDLVVKPGEIVGVVGESGSGKSTLVHAMLRLLRPPGIVTGGHVLWRRRDGQLVDVLALEEDALRRLRWSDFSIVLQSAMDALNPVARLDAQFADVLAAKNPGMRRAAIAARTRELLATVGVPVERMRSYPHELSGGTRQRAAIALALACNPRLVVMDEATTAVDVVMQRQIVDQVLRLRDLLGFAVVFVTHDLALLLEIADTVVVMRNGKVVERSDVEDVGGPRSEEYTRELFHAFPTLTPTAMGLERPDDARV